MRQRFERSRNGACRQTTAPAVRSCSMTSRPSLCRMQSGTPCCSRSSSAAESIAGSRAGATHNKPKAQSVSSSQKRVFVGESWAFSRPWADQIDRLRATHTFRNQRTFLAPKPKGAGCTRLSRMMEFPASQPGKSPVDQISALTFWMYERQRTLAISAVPTGPDLLYSRRIASARSQRRA